jgi:transposase
VIQVAPGTKVYLACRPVSMRYGFDGLAAQVASVLNADPFSGHLFLFRGRKADLLKIVFWDGTGLCLFTKRLEQSRFFWPVADEATGSVMLTSAQLSMLIEGIDWRSPERRWRPSVAG